MTTSARFAAAFTLCAALAALPTRAFAYDPDARPSLMYAETFAGLSFIDLGAKTYDNLYPADFRSSGLGPFLGVTLGIRTGRFTFGVRAVGASYSDFGMGTVGLHFGARFPRFGIFQPFSRIGPGYVWINEGGAHDGRLKAASTDGFAIDAIAGAHLYITDHFYIGSAINLAFVALWRGKVGEPYADDPVAMSLGRKGSSFGVQLRLEILRIGFSFL